MGVPWIYTEQKDNDLDHAKLQELWVKNSFYRLNVYFRQSSVEQHTQVPSFSMPDLFSGVGGILGLWLGISVMTIIEMFSFLMYFTANVFKLKSSSRKVDVNEFNEKKIEPT